MTYKYLILYVINMTPIQIKIPPISTSNNTLSIPVIKVPEPKVLSSTDQSITLPPPIKAPIVKPIVKPLIKPNIKARSNIVLPSNPQVPKVLPSNKTSDDRFKTLAELIYELQYKVAIGPTQSIRFKDGNRDNLHYTNLELVDEVSDDRSVEWRFVSGFEEYVISNRGNVFSLKRFQFLKPDDDNAVYLYNGPHRKYFALDRLVLLNFMANMRNLIIDHIDGDRTNNRLDNLREVPVSESQRHKQFSKLRANEIAQYELDGTFIRNWSSMTEISNSLGFGTSAISKCCSGGRPSAYGFIWKNLNYVADVSDFVDIKMDNDKTYSNYKIDRTGAVLGKYNKKIKPIVNNHGILMFNLTSDLGTNDNLFIHHLVACTFIENPHHYTEVVHIDGNKENNEVSNLEWREAPTSTPQSNWKRINQIDRETDEVIATFDSIHDACIALNRTNGSNIVRICQGHGHIAYGYKWSYA
jgi:hypothetical protein